ncbi:DNA repair protein rad50 [Podochytrium sp. JEL0797]|nr:DNA repair protein rad50 [Podochytrium sp. JEL0797]
MSEIEKLLISGIRSFGPDHAGVIEFYTPLTLIVGHNGAGKTTIIESLKFATMGAMPPNAKHSFIHDPKLAQASEVKGQIKLQFKNVNGKKLTATRNVVAALAKGKVNTFKSLESVLVTRLPDGKDDPDGVSITSKCSEFDSLIPTHLGVSRAILDNVIFCHQDDSFWPLAEPSVLKKKFDDIFASTRYTKALEEIRRLRKNHAVTVKVDKGELEHLRLIKDKDGIQSRIEAARERKSQLDGDGGEIDVIQQQLRNLEREQQKLQNVYSEIQQREIRKNVLQESIEEMKMVIELYEDSDEQLQSMLDQYQDSIEIQQVELAELNEACSKYNKNVAALESQVSALLTSKGQLQAEVDANKRRVTESEHRMTTLAKQTNMTGFSAPFSDADITRFVDTLKDTLASQTHSLEISKADSQAKESVIHTRLQKAQTGITQQQESKKMLKKQMDATRSKVSSTTTTLHSLTVTQTELSHLTSRVTEEQDWITNAQRTHNPMDLEQKLHTLADQLSHQDTLSARLQNEMGTLNMESEARARLGVKVAEKKRREEVLKGVQAEVKRGVEGVLRKEMKVESCLNDVAMELRNKERKLNQNKSELEEKRGELSGVEAKLSMTRARLQSLMKDVETKSKQISEACGGSDLLHAYKEAEEAYNKELGNEKVVEAATVMIDTYMKRFKRDQCCPLCTRGFSNETEEESFVKRLKDQLAKFPNKKEIDHLLTTAANRLKLLSSLKTTHHEVERLRDHELPAVKQTIAALEKEKDALVGQVEDLEGDYAVLQVDADTLTGLRNKCNEMLKVMEEVGVMETEVATIQRNLSGSGGGGKSMSQVQEEYEEVQGKCKNMRLQMERTNNELRTRQRELQSHEKLLQEAQNELQQKSFKWQERERLQASIGELKAEMDRYSREIEVADSVILELTPSVRAIEQELSAHRENWSREESGHMKTIQEMRNHISGVVGLQNEQRRFNETNTPARLEKCTTDMNRLRAEMEQLVRIKQEATDRISTIQKTSSEVTVVQRAISDNLKYREQVRLVEEVQKEISKLQREVNKFDQQSVHTKRVRLTKEFEKLSGELAGLVGEVKQMEEQESRLDRDLAKDFSDVVQKHQLQVVKLKTESLAIQDLEKYSKALENAIMKYHTMKMDEINKIIRELWVNTYKGNDIETIEIRSDNEGTTKKNQSYNYRVVMIKEQAELDMRGRCSAGQKVLACLIIRLALAETFCLNCGILALDEPTTNLDRDNSDALAESLSNIIRIRRQQRNFQLIIITHDEEFMNMIGHHDYADYYFRVSKDHMQHSVIEKQRIVRVSFIDLLFLEQNGQEAEKEETENQEMANSTLPAILTLLFSRGLEHTASVASSRDSGDFVVVAGPGTKDGEAFRELFCSEFLSESSLHDDLLFFVARLSGDISVKRKTKPGVMPSLDEEINWPETFFLNLIVQMHCFLTVSVCKRDSSASRRKSSSAAEKSLDLSSPNLSQHQQQQSKSRMIALRRITKKVYAAPYKSRMDIKDAFMNEIAYPLVYYTVNDYESTDLHLHIQEREYLCVELCVLVPNSVDSSAFEAAKEFDVDDSKPNGGGSGGNGSHTNSTMPHPPSVAEDSTPFPVPDGFKKVVLFQGAVPYTALLDVAICENILDSPSEPTTAAASPRNSSGSYTNINQPPSSLFTMLGGSVRTGFNILRNGINAATAGDDSDAGGVAIVRKPDALRCSMTHVNVPWHSIISDLVAAREAGNI